MARVSFRRCDFLTTTEADLRAYEYSLIQVVVSMVGGSSLFENGIGCVIKEASNAIVKPEHRESILVRVVQSPMTIREAQGFKLLSECGPADHNLEPSPNAMPALSDAILNGIQAVAHTARFLRQRCYLANAMIFVLADPKDRYCDLSLDEITDALRNAVSSEDLESLTSVWTTIVEPNNRMLLSCGEVVSSLRRLNDVEGFTSFVGLVGGGEATMAQVSSFLGASISAVRHALGSGRLPSLPLDVTTIGMWPGKG